jgi:hypothetical protein
VADERGAHHSRIRRGPCEHDVCTLVVNKEKLVLFYIEDPLKVATVEVLNAWHKSDATESGAAASCKTLGTCAPAG